MNKYEIFKRYIKESEYIVALTGAGISTNAGIPDFRGDKGVYTLKIVPSEKVFDIEYFLNNPEPFYEFTRGLFHILKEAKPTKAHYFLAHLEKMGKLKCLITQNIDGLHRKAGSRNIIEIHGSYERSYCMECGREYSLKDIAERLEKERVPKCDCGGVIKPDVVFFGESVKEIEKAMEEARRSDLFLIFGSSLFVQPASLLPYLSSGRIVIVNRGILAFPKERADIIFDEDCDIVAEEMERRLG